MENKAQVKAVDRPVQPSTLDVKEIEKSVTNKVIKQLFVWFILGFVGLKILQIIFPFSGTYLDETEVTARLGYKLMRRSEQLALEAYPGYREVKDKIAKIENRLDAFAFHVHFENVTFRKEDGFLAQFVSKSAREEWMFGNFEGHIAEQGRSGLAADIQEARNDCENLWNRYYREEWDLNKDYYRDKWSINWKSLQYYIYLNEIASREFENSMRKLNEKMERKHWDLMWAIIEVAHSQTKEDQEKGFEFKQYSKDEGDRHFFKWDFQRKYETILQVKCHYKREEVWPYSDTPAEQWDMTDGVAKCGVGVVGYGSFWKWCLVSLFS